MKEKRKKYVKAGMVIGIAAALVSMYAVVSIVQEELYEPQWREIARITPELLATGDYDPGAGVSGWLSTFLLDYTEDPATVLANNATDWSSAATAMGYVDTDNTDTDIEHSRAFYFVVRCRFNDTVKIGGNFDPSRTRVTLTVSGDETISAVAITGDDTTINVGGGRAVISQNDSGDDFIWINFVWDDDNDGYRILADGSLDWSLLIEAKY
jgi:hypothetical protein